MAYNQTFASVYDLFMGAADYHRRAHFISGILKKNNIKKGILLDLACGTGKFSVEFALRGYDVIGVDISPDMLTEARKNAEETNREILFLCQDMTELDLYGTIDCCICCLDSLNHLEDYDSFRRTIEKVSLFMRPGGVFVFDVNTIYKHKKVLGGKTFVYEGDNSYLVWQNSECENGSINLFLDIFTKGEDGTYTKTSEQFSENAYSLKTIKQTLKDCGFKVIKTYDDINSRSPRLNSERVTFAAKKI